MVVVVVVWVYCGQLFVCTVRDWSLLLSPVDKVYFMGTFKGVLKLRHHIS